MNNFFSTGAEHLSTYNLELVNSTPLHKFVVDGLEKPMPSQQKVREMVLLTDQLIEENGFTRYTVEQASVRGKENPYSFFVAKKSVIGIGAGAFSYYNGWVYRNFKKTREYSANLENNLVPVELGKRLSFHEQAVRYLVKNLLFLEVDLKDFFERFGVHPGLFIDDIFEEFEKEGLIELRDDKLLLTFEGRLNIFSLCRRLFSEEYIKLLERFEAKQ